LSIEIPETQQEILTIPQLVAVEVNRPVGFHSQDYSTVAGSQVASVIATQGSGASKDTTEGDSTLGSSLPPDSPVDTAADDSLIQQSSSQVLLSYPSTGPRSPPNSTTSVPGYGNPVLNIVDSPRVGQQSQTNPLELLVVRSDPIGAPDKSPSRFAERPAQRTNRNLPSTRSFCTDQEDLDLQPISDPNLSRAESGIEGEIQVLPAASSPAESANQDSVQLRVTRTHPSSIVASARFESSQGGSRFSPCIVNTLIANEEREELEKTPQSTSAPIGAVHGRTARPRAGRSIHGSPLTSSRRFHSQLSWQESPAVRIESPLPTSRVRKPSKSQVTFERHSQPPASLSLSGPSLRLQLPTTQTPPPVSSSLHPASSPHDSVSSGASIPYAIGFAMPTSHRESSSRVRRPPTAQSEVTSESELREKLRQIRATSRANQTLRSKSQAQIGSPKSPAATSLGTRSLRRASPEKNIQPWEKISTAAEDQPIPTLENFDRAASEMELDKVEVETAFSSSLAPSQAVLDAALEKSIQPTQDDEAEKSLPELDIPTMPLLQPSEFVVPLPIDGRIKHQYVAELKEKYSSISDFLKSPRSPRLIDAMSDLIRRLNDTVVHTDLGLNGPATQIASTTEEVLWAEDASSKFAFLAHIISTLRGSSHHIVLVARSGTAQDLLRSYLKGKHVNYREYTEGGSMEDLQEGDSNDHMEYTLLPALPRALKNIPRSASLIIAFDDSFDAAMLPEWCSTTPFVPVLLLLVVNSAEHVGRCIPQDVPEPERLRRFIKAVVHVHNELGDMPLHLDYRHAFNLEPGARLALVKKDLGAKIEYAAGKTAEALRSKNFALNFKLRSISELELSGLEDQPPSTEGSKEVSSSASRAGTPAGQKRLRVSYCTEAIGHSNDQTG
jgi:hypothetical protein